jgi:16S rRNA (cytosine967-C5)-methyltransferase
VQDEAAQLAAQILSPGACVRVLDACAAPGGKTAHLLELGGAGLSLLALDSSALRLQRVRENLARLGLSCTIVAGDAGLPSDWWDGHHFDKILLDAPCSALGVMRRHPDIRLRRTAADVAEVGLQQRRLVHALWPLLARGGQLLYATCSILRAENDEVIDDLLAAQPDAQVLTLPTLAGRPTRHGRQILPGDDDMDGFYYCLLRKQESS